MRTTLNDLSRTDGASAPLDERATAPEHVTGLTPSPGQSARSIPRFSRDFLGRPASRVIDDLSERQQPFIVAMKKPVAIGYQFIVGEQMFEVVRVSTREEWMNGKDYPPPTALANFYEVTTD